MKVLRRQDIDLERWDTMVWHSENALFYNLSWCLDTLCEDWLVILKDDYHAGIALPIRSKLGIKYTYNPFLFHRISAIGIWSKEELDEALWISSKYVDVRIREKIEGAKDWSNYELELDSNYLELIQGYNSNAKRNIKKGNAHNLNFKPMNNAALISFFFKENVSFNKLGIKEKEYENFEKLMLEAFDCEIGHGFVVEMKEETVATAFFIEFNNRLTFVKGTSSAIGRDFGAMHFLFDKIFNEYAGQSITLDFSGSNVSSVAQFYKSFGATDRPICYVKRNHLPFPLNQLKKG
ncbi:hypothetical protein N9M27_02105 [Flavobacteriales bacterium]|nr:hypothetical protein [Flavobacteriales bacterium]